ncbi:hypothetical protein NPIL_10911, partial [Nephila pilipes]
YDALQHGPVHADGSGGGLLQGRQPSREPHPLLPERGTRGGGGHLHSRVSLRREPAMRGQLLRGRRILREQLSLLKTRLSLRRVWIQD